MADKIPFALNVLKFQRYNFTNFSCEEVVFFEYIIVKSKSFKQNSFFHSSETIFKETGIKKHSLSSIIKRFEQLGYLKVEVKGMPRVKYFIVNFVRIYEDIALIYHLDENGKPLYDFRKLLADFFQPLVETYQEKYIKKHNKEILKKEKLDDVSDLFVQNLKFFNSKLLDLKLELNLSPSQCSFSDVDLKKALDHYEPEELVFFLKKFYQTGRQKKLKDFLQLDPVTGEKIIFIEEEKVKEARYFNKFFEEIEKTYNTRIEMHNKNKEFKRAKSLTKLVINQNIKNQFKDALEIFGEIGVNHAFLAYTDAVLSGNETPKKFLPFFLAKPFGEFGVIETYLDNFNMNYSYNK